MERLSDYDYDLPDSAIAQKPLDDRAASKLLWLRLDGRPLEDHTFRDAVELLREGDLLVLNDARVSAIRLIGVKPTGGQVELLLLRELGDGRFECLAKPGKRLQPGACIEFENGIRATIEANLTEGRKRVRLECPTNLGETLAQVGTVPLPPYIYETLTDPNRYQTVYANAPGSAAAPTAGLHFTPEILASLTAKGVELAKVTLDVGLDTFRPVQTEDPSQHPIHGEKCTVPQETADAVRNCKGRIVAVGTTTVRTLETMATGPRTVKPGTVESKLFIRPGFKFHVIDGMFSNFHMPRTTMLMMISALVGRNQVMASYAHALHNDYRFLSFGDSMLIL